MPRTLESGAGPVAGTRRFTLDGDEALERHLALACERIVSGIRGLVPGDGLEAVLLGGGYGRGEGGVLRGPAGDRPYNDLEFYVAIRGSRHLNEARYGRRLEVLGEILTHLADAEVEFKVTSLAEMASSRVSMFSYDLACGHRLLWGAAPGPGLPGWSLHLSAENIPQSEATRLLMNRCSGLLFARDQLGREPFTPVAAGFVGRNIAKAQLACGDALLAAFGRYHWSCGERHRRLADFDRARRPAWFDAALRHHAEGVVFKLHPDPEPAPRDVLLGRLAEITALSRECWLWVEARRLGRPFATARAYAEDGADKCPGSSPPMNLVLNLRADGYRPRAWRGMWRHPRQRIFHSLALLLWDPDAAGEATLRARLAAELNVRGTGPVAWAGAYRGLWSRVR
jgi:hypothetical protein